MNQSAIRNPHFEITRVLLIEDNPGDARLIREMLGKARGATFDLECIGRLSTGLERLDKGEIAVILLDLELPDSRGLDTFVRVHAQAPQVPIVVLTGFEDVTRAMKAVRFGAKDYLVKEQLDSNVLVRAIHYVLERKRAEEQVQQSLEKLRKALSGIIEAMALTVETRDPYTAVHQRRAANLARAIAMEMGLSEDRVKGIRMAGVIHDLGKLSVPIDILSKPSRLTEIEFNLIKTHAQIGHDILKPIEFPWPVAQIVLQHHERMDGSGYPSGLSGEEIIPEARILGVADVVEAMASHRPYRAAIGIEKALEEISKNRGILYDPEVVNACLRLFTEKGFTFEKDNNLNQQPVLPFSSCDCKYTPAVQKL